jgi:NADPH:quinone reductase-like Zn-dependent oxidoreductase
MRAVVITHVGGPEVLQIREVPEPIAGPEDVVVRIRAAGVNRADLLQRRGRYAAPPGAAADIPGLEFAGEIESCGGGVRTLQAGDRVMGILGGGGYAEKVALHERLCLRIPPAFSWENAGATPEAFLTAYDALFRRGSLSAGEMVLLQAAGSGVGTAAAQLALVAGSRVIGLSRTADKRRRLRELGLQQVFDPQAPNLGDAIMAATGGDGVDLVLDLIGASAWPLHLTVLRERGRIVVIGLMGGSRLEIDLFQLAGPGVRRTHRAFDHARSRLADRPLCDGVGRSRRCAQAHGTQRELRQDRPSRMSRLDIMTQPWSRQ